MQIHSETGVTQHSPVKSQANRTLPLRRIFQLRLHHYRDDFLHTLSLHSVAEFCVAIVFSSTLCTLPDVLTGDEYYEDARGICHTDGKMSAYDSKPVQFERFLSH